MAERKGMAITALALGIVGLFTAGGLGVGSLVGLALAGVVLTGASRTGRDVAWAAVAANTLALLSVFPAVAAIWVYSASPQLFVADRDSLPEPAPWPTASAEFVPQALPFPPPPPPAAAAAPRVRAKSPAGLERADAAAPLRVGGTIREPRKTRNVSPVYPRDAIAARVQGVVILECTISPRGKVVAVKTLRSVPTLDQAAIEAVKQWEYTPTLLNGVAVPVIMTVTVNFKLS